MVTFRTQTEGARLPYPTNTSQDLKSPDVMITVHVICLFHLDLSLCLFTLLILPLVLGHAEVLIFLTQSPAPLSGPFSRPRDRGGREVMCRINFPGVSYECKQTSKT